MQNQFDIQRLVRRFCRIPQRNDLLIGPRTCETTWGVGDIIKHHCYPPFHFEHLVGILMPLQGASLSASKYNMERVPKYSKYSHEVAYSKKNKLKFLFVRHNKMLSLAPLGHRNSPYLPRHLCALGFPIIICNC